MVARLGSRSPIKIDGEIIKKLTRANRSARVRVIGAISKLQLMCIFGALSAGLLVAVNPARVNVTITGTSPAPAKLLGNEKLTISQPGIFRFGLTERI